ncbi:MAG: ABC transporter permease [Acidimicrobiales bacterium]
MLPVIADDPDVVAANDTRSEVAESEGLATAVFLFDPVGAALAPVLTRGSMPREPDEVALAPSTAETMGVDVGDTVDMAGTGSSPELTVTRLAFVPQHPHNDYANGAWVTSQGYDDLFRSFRFHTVEAALRPGADPAVVVANRIRGTAGDVPEAAEFEIAPPEPIVAVAELRQVRQFPLVLAAFLALLALGAVGHALATAMRRRRHDVAVLRALGLSRRQCRTLVVTQASLLAVIGLLVGVPLGVALGRIVWRHVADTTPLCYVSPEAWWALILITPVALLAATLLAVRPSRLAASMRVSQVLRVEEPKLDARRAAERREMRRVRISGRLADCRRRRRPRSPCETRSASCWCVCAPSSVPTPPGPARA